jgi:hypothetical protein
LTGQRQRCAVDLDAAEKAQRAFIGARADEARKAQAILEAQRVQGEVDVLKAAVKALEELQVKAVDTAFGKLLETANAMVGDLLLTPLAYRDGEIGRLQDGLWISHRTFSGTEKLLAYAALSVALAVQSPIKIVLMDELGRLEAGLRAKLVYRMRALTDLGDIHQFIGVCAGSDTYWIPPSTEVFNLD